MQGKSDSQLLREYAENGSEAAFSEIVARYTDLVYSSAVRQVGSPDLARDVAQSVFTDLARKAGSLARKLKENDTLIGWLYRGTRYEALPILRTERRRLARERLAMQHLDTTSEPSLDWDRIRPVLDEAMASLGDQDRDALLLRYFKNEDLRSVGHALGVSDDAAQKRVTRALEKLQTYLARRGVTTSAAAVSTVLSTNAVPMAPAGLATTLASASLADAGIGTVTTLTLLKLMTMTKAKIAVAGVILAVGIATPLLLQKRTNAKLRSEIDSLRQQTQGLARLREENQRLGRLKEAADARGRNVARANEEPRSLLSMPKTNAAVSGASGIVVPTETPDAPFVPAASWAKGSIDTWTNAMQSHLWATNNRDSNAFANTVIWDPAAKSWLEERLAGSPDYIRQRVRSVDGLVYDWWINERSTLLIAAYRVIAHWGNSDNASALVELQDEHGRTRMSYQMILHRDEEGWRVVFTADFIGWMENYLYHLVSSNQADGGH